MHISFYHSVTEPEPCHIHTSVTVRLFTTTVTQHIGRQQNATTARGTRTREVNNEGQRWRGEMTTRETTTRKNDNEGKWRWGETTRGDNDEGTQRGETTTRGDRDNNNNNTGARDETTTRGDDNKGGRQQGETTTTTTQGLETCRAPGIDKFFLSFSFILYLLTSIYRLSIQRERWHRGSRCIEPPLYVSFNIFFYVLLH